jgi:hypothetical protein
MTPDNPYATPKTAGEVELPPVAVTMPMRWFFIVMFSLAAFFQIKIGATVAMEGYFPDEAALKQHPAGDAYWIIARYLLPWFVVMGLVSVHAAWSLVRRRWSRTVFWTGMLASFFTWVPFLILNVVPVTLWILRRPGRNGNVRGVS